MDGHHAVEVTATDAGGLSTIASVNPVVNSYALVSGAANPFDGMDFGTASNIAFVDIDNDGDLDAFVGNNQGTLDYLENTGSSKSASFELRTGVSNPLSNVDVGNDANVSFMDADGDGDLDAFVGPFDATGIRYFENTGTQSAASFVEVVGAGNPLNFSSPSNQPSIHFADIDNDGDEDAFIGYHNGLTYYYENTGTGGVAQFTPRYNGDNPLNFDVGIYAKPFLLDIDGDGDLDAFIGEYYGAISFAENVGSASNPNFVLSNGASNLLDGVNVGLVPDISFADLNGDGLPEGYFGAIDGLIHYLEPTGPAAPIFVDATAPVVAFASNSHIEGSYPQISGTVDDPEASIELVFEGQSFAAVNNGDGTWSADVSGALVDGNHAFEVRATDVLGNLGTATTSIGIAPIVTIDTLSTQDTTPTITGTIDDTTATVEVSVGGNTYNATNHGNGTWSASVTNALAEGDYSLTVRAVDAAGLETVIEPPIAFNPLTDTTGLVASVRNGVIATPELVDIDNDGDLDLFVGSQSAGLQFYENIGNASAPSFVERTGADNPFDGIISGSFYYVEFADIDGDGDQDAFMTNNSTSSGPILYYENTGTAAAPTFVERTGAANPLDSGVTGRVSFEDADGDGDLDMTAIYTLNSGGSGDVGVRSRYYENTGDSLTPQFVQRTDQLVRNVFWYRESATWFDVNQDDLPDLLIASVDGTIEYRQAVEGSDPLTFTLGSAVDNPFNGVDVGTQATLTLGDLNGDGYVDAIIGNQAGTLSYFLGSASTNGPVHLTITPAPAAKAAIAPPPVAAALANDAPVMAAVSPEEAVVMPSEAEIAQVSEEQLREAWIALREENAGAEPTRAQLAGMLSGLVAKTAVPTVEAIVETPAPAIPALDQSEQLELHATFDGEKEIHPDIRVSELPLGADTDEASIQVFREAALSAQSDMQALLGTESSLNALSAEDLGGLDLANKEFDTVAANDQTLNALTQAMAVFDSQSSAIETDGPVKMEKEENVSSLFVAGGGF